MLLLLFFRLVAASFNKLNKLAHDIIFFFFFTKYSLSSMVYPLSSVVYHQPGKTDNHFSNFKNDPPKPSLI